MSHIAKTNSPAKSGKATGPRTAEGRARAAQNARKHGLTSARLDASSIRSMQEMISAHFAPRRCDPVALRRLAEAEVRVAKIRSIQDAAGAELDHHLATDIMPADASAPRDDRCVGAALDLLRRLSRYRAEAEAQRHKALHALIAGLHMGAVEGTTR